MTGHMLMSQESELTLEKGLQMVKKNSHNLNKKLGKTGHDFELSVKNTKELLYFGIKNMPANVTEMSVAPE